MALNPIACTENVVRSFLRYQLTAYPFADRRLHAQMRGLLSLDETRRSPLLKGPYVSLSRPFRQGAAVDSRVGESVLHPHLGERVRRELTHLYSHQGLDETLPWIQDHAHELGIAAGRLREAVMRCRRCRRTTTREAPRLVARACRGTISARGTQPGGTGPDAPEWAPARRKRRDKMSG